MDNIHFQAVENRGKNIDPYCLSDNATFKPLERWFRVIELYNSKDRAIKRKFVGISSIAQNCIAIVMIYQLQIMHKIPAICF